MQPKLSTITEKEVMQSKATGKKRGRKPKIRKLTIYIYIDYIISKFNIKLLFYKYLVLIQYIGEPVIVDLETGEKILPQDSKKVEPGKIKIIQDHIIKKIQKKFKKKLIG